MSRKQLSPANYSVRVIGIYAQKTKEGFTLWEEGTIVGEGSTIGEAKANYTPPMSYEEANRED
jgi:hypothetical protein